MHSNSKMKFSSYRAVSLLWFLLIMAGLVAQVQSSPCTSTFFSALVQLIPCRAAVAPFSPIPPSDACCNALKALGQPCLCVLVNGPPVSGVDRNMASQLPEKCTANFEPCEIM
ncbi:lipid-transfer protein DIR [Spatholobus suberectus]|nr:lipid-transfer protein DIR [Spatholobus suberectus]